jgi:hypothetical protein
MAIAWCYGLVYFVFNMFEEYGGSWSFVAWIPLKTPSNIQLRNIEKYINGSLLVIAFLLHLISIVKIIVMVKISLLHRSGVLKTVQNFTLVNNFLKKSSILEPICKLLEKTAWLYLLTRNLSDLRTLNFFQT